MDFCTESLLTSVMASQVSTDGYEAQNLISTDTHKKNKGFLAESFIKPPVDIVFEFTCNVNVSHIVIKPTVGGQRSTGFDISSYVERTGLHLRSTSVSDPPRYDEFVIAKGFFKEESEIVFMNKQFRSQSQFLKTLDRSSIPCTHRELRNQCADALRHARKIKIRVWRTSQGNVPALGAVRIFGVPAHGSDPLIAEQYQALERQVQRNRTSENQTRPLPPPSKTSPFVLPSNVPQEFSDPITCEIMILPVLLPSGNTIDQSTLDKHVATEASWGRPPNDPFTGMAFHSEHKPVTNSLLKSRIDHFLIHNEQLVNGRTTGTRRRELEMPQNGGDNETEPPSKKTAYSELQAVRCPESSRSQQSLDEVLKNTLKSMTSYTTRGELSNSQNTSKWTRVFLKPTGCSVCKDVFEPMYLLPCSHVTCKKCIITGDTEVDNRRKCPLCQTHFSNSKVVRTHLPY